jgi:hypothetical protein
MGPVLPAGAHAGLRALALLVCTLLVRSGNRQDCSENPKKMMAGNPAIKLQQSDLSGNHSTSDFACRFAGALSSNIALANIIGSQNSNGMSLLLANVRARIAPKHWSSRR